MTGRAKDSVDRFLGRRRRGAIAIIAVFALIPAVALFSASMNGGQATDDRRVAQDAADAVVRMHAAWTARSLNHIAMNNVEATQLLTVAIGSEALADALDELETKSHRAMIFIGVHSLRCPGFVLPKVIAFCFAMHARYAYPAERALRKVASIRRRYDPAHGVRTSHRGLSAIDRMNREIAARHSQAVGEMARDFAEDYGVDAVHFADPCLKSHSRGCRRAASSDGMSLPIEPGGAIARAGACLAMSFGTTVGKTTFARKGFPLGRGPVTAGGSVTTPHVKPHIERITGIGAELERFHRYYKRLRLIRPGGFTRFPQILNFLAPQQNMGLNAFTMRFEGKYGSFCAGVEGFDFLAGYALQAPVPEFWRLSGVGGGQGVAMRTPDAMNEDFRILAYVLKGANERIGERFRSSGPRRHTAYAQATVFNPDGADLFSQNWRQRITPASRVSSPGEAARKLALQAPGAFNELSEILAAASGGLEFGRINAH